MRIKVTRHARNRVHERACIPKRAVHGWVNKAVRRSVAIHGNDPFDRWARDKLKDSDGSKRIVRYREYLLVLKGEWLITILSVSEDKAERF